jgi:hypothetical protein
MLPAYRMLKGLEPSGLVTSDGHFLGFTGNPNITRFARVFQEFSDKSDNLSVSVGLNQFCSRKSAGQSFQGVTLEARQIESWSDFHTQVGPAANGAQHWVWGKRIMQ